MALSSETSSVSSRECSAGEIDQSVLSGEACIKCGFKCIEGCS